VDPGINGRGNIGTRRIFCKGGHCGASMPTGLGLEEGFSFPVGSGRRRGKKRFPDGRTSFHGDDLAPERLPLLFHFHLVALHVAQLPLDAFAQLVELLSLLLQM